MLSLVKGTKIRVIAEGGRTKLVPVEEIEQRPDHKASVYDWYGQRHTLTVSEAPCEAVAVLLCRSGEMMYVGEKHCLYGRQHGSAHFERYELADIDKPLYVRLPQRKISVDDNSLFETLEADDKSVHLIPKVARDMLPLMETAATCGITVHRYKTELRVDLERSRPVCFATKLINGNFDENLTGTLEELTAQAILQPFGPFDSQFIETTEQTGIIFEGSTLYNDVLLVKPRRIDRPTPVYHITGVDDVPVELTWFCS